MHLHTTSNVYTLPFGANFLVVYQKTCRRRIACVVCHENIQTLGHDCGILKRALDRYIKMLKVTGRTHLEYLKYAPKFPYNADRNYLGNLHLVDISLTGYCNDSEYPQTDMDEEYTLNVTRNYKRISSRSIWGILRGLESLSQLVYLANDLRTLVINVTNVHDYPRFPHRGLLLDTSRHYIPQEKILNVLDAMSYNKFNVFHWHIVDDYSFPYVSKTFPELSRRPVHNYKAQNLMMCHLQKESNYVAFLEKRIVPEKQLVEPGDIVWLLLTKGAYFPALVYAQDFVKEVQTYARDRGIRVLVEFDTPGHTLSWGLGNPELLTPCFGKDGSPTGGNGPIDPSKESNFVFLKRFFQEVEQVFHDRYIHLGGDEVDFTCWRTNPDINQFMSDLGIPGDYEALQNYYTQRLITSIHSMDLQSVVYEDVFTNGVNIPTSTVVQAWMPDNYRELMANVTARGHRIILSSCWYLDILATGGDWLKFYACEPLDFEGTPAQKARVIGGEACMWTEVVNEYNVESRIWPRASAVIEKLWSAPVENITSNYIIFDVGPRLEEHTCRMNKRGIGAQPPSAPNFCL